MPKPDITKEYNWIGKSKAAVWLGDEIEPNFEVNISETISYPNSFSYY